MDTSSALLAFCDGNPQVIGGFPSQRTPVMRSFGVSFVVRLSKPLNKYRVVGDLRRIDAHVASLCFSYAVMLKYVK